MQAQAQQTIAQFSNPSAQAKNSFPQDAGEKIDQLLTRLVLENIPHKFEDSKDWGRQVERWDGVKFRREGLR